MGTSRILTASFFAAAIALLIGSCSKDEGGTTPPATPTGISISQAIPTLSVGDSVSRTLSGGTPPYSLVSSGTTSIAVPTLSGTTLTVRAVANGNSTIIIGDAGSPQRTLSISIQVGAATVSFSGQIQPIFTANCAVSGCHVTGGLAPFSLASGASHDNLVNQAATSSPACSLPLRVKPFSADSSVMYKRISGPDCGQQMPQGASPLSSANQQLIRNWINQGAAEN
ncbi:MAG: hypothetical protein KF749_08790 [Bacteroidetes bacterium]|nr:hypothetical protein [Bacteroidota bacterium]MCW5895897.1 hypothetical protein [Bacteroidota bacterium]